MSAATTRAAARRAAALRAALHHPDCLGRAALQAWSRPPAAPAAPAPDPARGARWAAALARPEVDATILARGDFVLRAGRPGGAERRAPRWDADTTETHFGPVPAFAAGLVAPRPGR